MSDIETYADFFYPDNDDDHCGRPPHHHHHHPHSMKDHLKHISHDVNDLLHEEDRWDNKLCMDMDKIYDELHKGINDLELEKITVLGPDVTCYWEDGSRTTCAAEVDQDMKYNVKVPILLNIINKAGFADKWIDKLMHHIDMTGFDDSAFEVYQTWEGNRDSMAYDILQAAELIYQNGIAEKIEYRR